MYLIVTSMLVGENCAKHHFYASKILIDYWKHREYSF